MPEGYQHPGDVAVVKPYGGDTFGAIAKAHEELLALRAENKELRKRLGQSSQKAKKFETLYGDTKRRLEQAQKGNLLSRDDEDALFAKSAKIDFKNVFLGGRRLKIIVNGREAALVKGKPRESLIGKGIKQARRWLER